MYAIIETGGKQYRVEEGDILDIERVDADAEGNVMLRNVLFVQTETEAHVGTPLVPNFLILAKLLEEVRGPKVVAFKYKKRKRYRRKVGHRQDYTRVQITKITS